MRQSGEGFQKTGYKFRSKLFSGMVSQACQVEGKRESTMLEMVTGKQWLPYRVGEVFTMRNAEE